MRLSQNILDLQGQLAEVIRVLDTQLCGSMLKTMLIVFNFRQSLVLLF